MGKILSLIFLLLCNSAGGSSLTTGDGVFSFVTEAKGVSSLDISFSQGNATPVKVPAWYDQRSSLWRAHYRPDGPGEWVVKSEILRGKKSESSYVGVAKIDAIPPVSRQIVRTKGRFFRTQGGDLYFPLGQNTAWMLGGTPMKSYEKTFERMAQSGQNFARVWLCSWGINLEKKKGEGIKLVGADQLEEVLNLAQKYGLRIMLCLANFQFRPVAGQQYQ